MIKIKALNEKSDSSDTSDSECRHVTREAEEEGLNKLYMDALKAASENDTDGAIQLLNELKHEIEVEKPKVKDAMLLKRLKYLTYKNLGLLKDDLNLILDALDLDDSDFNLWITAGRKGKEKLDYLLAKYCFESAYKFNQSNYIVIDNLIDIYFVLNDLYSCVNMCLRALEIDSDFSKAITVINQCVHLMPPLVKDMQNYLNYVYVEYGGDYDRQETEEDAEASQDIINGLNTIKTKRLRPDDLEVGQSNKRKKLTLEIDRSRLRSLGEIGQKIKAIHEQIQQDFYNICSPIELDISNRPVPVIETAIAPPTVSAENEKTSGGDSNGKSSECSSQLAKSLMDFVDKRRSTRVKTIRSAKSRELDDDQSVFENIMELLPEDLKNSDESSKMDSLDKESSSNSGSIPMAESKAASDNNSNKAAVKESEAIDHCLERLEQLFSVEGKTVNIFQLIECFLCTLSSMKHISIPPVFTVLYQIFREQHELPCAIVCETGKDVSLEMIWTCLTANELSYNKNEALFLTQVLTNLSEKMSHKDYRNFVIRLLVLRGTKEFFNDCLVYALDLCSSSSQYNTVFKVNMPEKEEEVKKLAGGEEAKKANTETGKDAIEENKESYSVVASNNLVINEQYITTLLKMQTVPISERSGEKNYAEIIQLYFTKSESDLTVEEKDEFCQAIVSAKMWQKGVELFENWADLNDTALSTIYQCIKDGDRARLSPKMMSKMVKLAIEGKSALSWVILFWSLVAQGIKPKEPGNALIKLCTIGHHHLGRKGLCTANEGEFLLLSLSVFFEHELVEEAEKCTSCLFNFPSRKSIIPSHTSPHSELKWTHCECIYNYFEPDSMPEFDSNARQSGITQETKDFFLKILRLVPEELQPIKQSQNIISYIHAGGSLVEPNFPKAPPRILFTIYYLLADFHFKTKDFAKAKQFYIFDLTICTKRFDSWAGLALSFNYQLDQLLLDGSNVTNSEKYQKTAFNVIQCFEQALKLDETNTKLWIEFGLLCYNIASNMSRHRKISELFKWSSPEPSMYMFKYDEMLDKARNCFEKANSGETDADELWLSFYMLGKVSEKKGGNLLATLEYYEWAELCLYLDEATYPKKINYYNPPYLAVEALEVHYRIHATTLKFLLNNRKFSARMLRQIKLHLISASRSPFVSRKVYSMSTQALKKPFGVAKNGTAEMQGGITTPSSEPIDPQVGELLDDVLSIVGERDFKFDVNRSRNELIDYCLLGLKRCLCRYSAHYKSYYRLAHYFSSFNEALTAKCVLLGAFDNKYNPRLQFESEGGKSGAAGTYVAGLFSERKPTNFYNGIWRIPVDEIERAGTFSAHMFRCTRLLMHVATSTDDYNSLCNLAIQLHKTPDLDKRYLNDRERLELSVIAFKGCFNILKGALLSAPDPATKHHLVAEIQTTAGNFIKSGVYTKETISMCKSINDQLDGKQ